MKIGLAQVASVSGDIDHNISRHVEVIQQAVELNCDLVAFPELSLTGYEPTLGRQLAITAGDPRCAVFPRISWESSISIALGAPLSASSGTQIGLLLYEPQQPTKVYAKRYLHEDELPYFVPGIEDTGYLGRSHEIALAICYELSVPEHAISAQRRGAQVYLASVAKTTKGIVTAAERLSAIAFEFHWHVLVVNSVGRADGAIMAGQTAVWTPTGECLARLGADDEGLLVYDTTLKQAATKAL